MWIVSLRRRGWIVVLSSAYASLMFDGGDYTSPNVRMPKRQPSRKKLLEIADQVVDEHLAFINRPTPGELDQ